MLIPSIPEEKQLKAKQRKRFSQDHSTVEHAQPLSVRIPYACTLFVIN